MIIENENRINGKHNSSEIIIGKNVWIGASCIFRRNNIKNNCLIGDGTMIKGNVKKDGIVVQNKR